MEKAGSAQRRSRKARWDTGLALGAGPPGGCWPAGGLLQTSPEAPERGVRLGRGTRVTEHKVFQERLAPGGSGNFFFFF